MRSHFPSVATVAAFIVATIVPSGCSNGESSSGDQSDTAASGGGHAKTGGAAGTSGSSSGDGAAAGTGQGGASGSAAGGTVNAAGGTNESGGAATHGGTTSGGARAAGGATSGGASTTGGATSGGASTTGGATSGGASGSGGSPAAGVDLIVTQIGLSPMSPTASQAVTFSATVKNQGTAPTPAGTIVGVLFSVDGTSMSWSDTNTQALAAGATITLTANGGPSNLATWSATSGSHQVVAFVDDVNRISESNEGNNKLTLPVTVGGGSCSPSCSGKVCGSDGCSGSCGSCGSGMSCNASGQCATGSTVPPSWNSSPPAGMSPAPSGAVVGNAGEFDTGPLATNEIWDNFDGASGSKPDSRLWVLDTTNQGGTQTYDPARTFLDGTGNAVLEAIQNGSTVYSGRFTSRTKFNMKYGWCAARIKFPKAGKSWFPAFWMLHQGYNTNPNYGEIDIMEFFGDTTKYSTHVYIKDSTLQSDKPVPANQSGGNAGDGYHTYWMQWEADRLQIGVDDLVMGDWGPTSVPAGAWDSVITQQPFYFIANFAVHPSYLPAPLPTDFPARMLIDWIWYKPL